MKSYIFGAVAACTATILTHPLDVIKVRKQLHSNISYRNLFSGIGYALKRQVVYSGIRFGLWDTMGQLDHLSLSEKTCRGAFVGAVGAAAATPFDLAKVRKQSNIKHQYTGIINMWKGGAPTIARAAVVTSCQFATHHHSKSIILDQTELLQWQAGLAASLTAGFVTSLVSNPLDVMKTWRMAGRLSNPQIPGMIKIISSEGVGQLYRGIGPTMARMCPYVVLLFTTKEMLDNNLFGNKFLKSVKLFFASKRI